MTSDVRSSREYKSSPLSRKHKAETNQSNGIVKEKVGQSSREMTTENSDNSRNASEQKRSS